MEKKEKRIYEAPSLTVATFKAEAGYAQSLTSVSLLSLISAHPEYGTQALESRTDHGATWGSEWN